MAKHLSRFILAFLNLKKYSKSMVEFKDSSLNLIAETNEETQILQKEPKLYLNPQKI